MDLVTPGFHTFVHRMCMRDVPVRNGIRSGPGSILPDTVCAGQSRFPMSDPKAVGTGDCLGEADRRESRTAMTLTRRAPVDQLVVHRPGEGW
ncbi:hypothetical protein GCM10027273_03320 [Nocardioides pakistanensis]